ncbi:hypothetical protein [Microcoleus sp. bin38.metabat.b11b12b14.051]|uniref:hypothetical protein n=1 Tax=Microcoleus sp. bin38.metabat.b11b12b14.051 TaxID=2742709 RepID=UPI0025CDB27E|nr:hypothetical protein [Microcoleus sp. bin38.metabat.b11b12b14.051]
MLRSLARGTAYIAVTQLNCTYVTVGVRNVGSNGKRAGTALLTESEQGQHF